MTTEAVKLELTYRQMWIMLKQEIGEMAMSRRAPRAVFDIREIMGDMERGHFDPNGEKLPIIFEPVMVNIHDERLRQFGIWGEQNHPDGTSRNDTTALHYRAECDAAAKDGTITWRHILLEEVYEALAETDPINLRTELIQVGAVVSRWAEAIDRRMERAAEPNLAS